MNTSCLMPNKRLSGQEQYHKKKAFACREMLASRKTERSIGVLGVDGKRPEGHHPRETLAWGQRWHEEAYTEKRAVGGRTIEVPPRARA